MSTKPLRRDRSKDLDRLAKRITDMLKAGCDPIMVNDLYERFAKDWDRPPHDKVDRLALLQDRAIVDIVEYGEDPDRIVECYGFLWERICNHGDPWPDDPVPLRRQSPTRGQQAAQLGAGVMAGYYGSKMVGNILGDIFKPVGALLRLFK